MIVWMVFGITAYIAQYPHSISANSLHAFWIVIFYYIQCALGHSKLVAVMQSLNHYVA